MNTRKKTQTSEENFSAADICFAVAKELKLSMLNYESEDIGWYRFENNENKDILIKFVANEKSNISFKCLNKITDDITQLIIVYKKDEKYVYIRLDTKFIKLEKEKEYKDGYIKFINTYIRFYPTSNLNIPEIKLETSKPLMQQPNHDFTSTVARYKSIMERNYDYHLNYLLFQFYLQNTDIEFFKDKSKKMTKIKYIKALTGYLEKNSIFREVCEYLNNSDGKQSIASQIKEDYKNLYKGSMSEIRKRNAFFRIIKENKEIMECIEEYQANYNIYYKREILTFKDFFEFWNQEDSRTCEYCGISEKQIDILDKKSKIETKRFYSRGRTMEIDKIDAFGEYTKDNIILSCYWCNNAKTDEFVLDDFKLIAKGINLVWNKRLDTKTAVKFPEETYIKKGCR